MFYSEIEKDFYEQIKKKKAPVKLYEYVRDDWTYHCKGMWIKKGKGVNMPSITLIGSPNFGSRSVNRDLEVRYICICIVIYELCLICLSASIYSPR